MPPPTIYNSETPGGQNVSHYRHLWLAVLFQILCDFKNDKKNRAEQFEKLQAERWLDIRNKDFRMVCEFAGVDPHYAYEKIAAYKKGDLNFTIPASFSMGESYQSFLKRRSGRQPGQRKPYRKRIKK